ncbi:TldD/PmbA family protein [Candidatus Woesearchaeota archaeon]|nr:TldD/PmbA family protein [Candidatus Woesearchaeota archaeon]
MREIAEKIEKKFKNSGADDVIVTIGEEEKTQIKFSNNKVSATQTWQSMNVSLFAAIDKRLVLTSIHAFSQEIIDETIKKLLKFAKATEQNKEYSGIAKGPFKYQEREGTYDKAVAELAEKDVDLVEKGISTALSNGAKRTAGVLETTKSKVYLRTSNSVEAEEKGTKIHFSIRAFTDNEASGHYVATARMLKDCNIESAAARAAEIAKKARNPLPIKQGKYDVLFEPLPASNIIEQMGVAASAFNVESGLSCLAEKIGSKVASKEVTILDDATLPGGMGAASFDAEGVPTQTNTIIENGVLKTYLHNTSTAKRYNTVTTANAGIVSPEPFNIVLKKGSFIKEELFEQIKRGLWITNVWYTRFSNYDSGDFSTIPRDGIFLIENGKIKSPVKDIRVSENLLGMFRNVSAIGEDAERVMGWEVETPVFTPPIVVKDVNITKSAE